MVTLYGIKTCDSCRKALKWLEGNGIVHTFQDLRIDGLDISSLQDWINQVGWRILLNTRSATWRSITNEAKANLDKNKAERLMVTHVTLIKRPVILSGGQVLVGFGEEVKSFLRPV